MEPLIWNKPPIWNTYAADRVVFRIGGFTVRPRTWVALLKKLKKRNNACTTNAGQKLKNSWRFWYIYVHILLPVLIRL